MQYVTLYCYNIITIQIYDYQDSFYATQHANCCHTYVPITLITKSAEDAKGSLPISVTSTLIV